MRHRSFIIGIAIAASLLAGISFARAETVTVKYRGPVDLTPFECTDISRSSFINRVCYDRANTYLVIKLNATYYHYCEVDPETVRGFLTAPSMGRFYNQRIKSRGGDGPFDCRTHKVPNY